MSASDYTKFKQSSVLLANQRKNLPKVLSGTEYTAFKTFTQEYSVTNSIPLLNQLLQPNHVSIMQMPIQSNSCSTFSCTRTQLRPNRQLNTNMVLLYTPGINPCPYGIKCKSETQICVNNNPCVIGNANNSK